MTASTTKTWAGFGARLGAFIVDFIIIGVLCLAIGFAGIGYFSELGPNARAIGLGVATLYFGILCSGSGGGASLGMRALGLKVAMVTGRPLGLPAAFGRALFLLVPIVLNGWFFNITDPVAAQVLSVIAITAVFGVSLAQVYLFLFNLPTRRLFHDLVFSSVVVRKDVKEFAIPPKAVVHKTVAFGIVLVTLGLSVASPLLIETWAPNLSATTAPIKHTMDAVNSLPGVAGASVTDNTMTMYANGKATTTRTLYITARVNKMPSDPNPLLAKIGAEVVKSYKFAPEQGLTIKIVYGFDMGFANYSTTQSASYSTACNVADVKCLNR